MIQKVGAERKINGKSRRFTYSNVLYDAHGWADAEKFLPADYDLVMLKLEGNKLRNGWSNGLSWDGLHLKKSEKVLMWKRKIDDM